MGITRDKSTFSRNLLFEKFGSKDFFSSKSHENTCIPPVPAQVEEDIMCFVPKRGYPSNQPNSSQPLICTNISFCGILNISQVSTCGNPFSATVKITSFRGKQQGKPQACQLVQVVGLQHPTGSCQLTFCQAQRLEKKCFNHEGMVQILRLLISFVLFARQNLEASQRNWCVGHEYYILIVFVMARLRFLLQMVGTSSDKTFLKWRDLVI